MSNLMNTLMEEMKNRFPEFAQSGQFTRKMIDQVQAEIGQKPNHSICRMATKIAHGVYQLDMVDNVTKLPKKKVVSAVDEVVSKPQTEQVVVPLKDPNFVPFGNYKDLEKIIKSKIFYPVFITGHSGNGKSTQIIQICAANNRSLIRMSVTKETDKSELLGSKTLVNGNIEIKEGPVIVAARTGSVLLLDELDAADANLALALQGVLEGKPIFFALTGEYITPAVGFNIIATANTKGKGSDNGRYIGTNFLNEAFLERFGETYEQDYPPPAVEKKMLLNWMNSSGCVDEEFADDLVKWADTIRKTFKDGAIDDVISTRRLEHIVKSYSIFKNKKRAIEKCTARFDEFTSQAFRDLFDKIAKDDSAPVEAVTA
jgi:hypothetical protein